MDDLAVCTCGHIWDEHEHVGSTACAIEDCPCIAWEDSGDSFEPA